MSTLSDTGINQSFKSDLPETHASVSSKLKRLIDIVGAVIGLSITVLLFVPIAVAIRLDSPGPIFYQQTRCGLLGKRFRIWKFRSMIPDAEYLQHAVQNQAKGLIFKNEADPRVTRVGKFLRRTSLDELPQFWNVLKGEMSLVGTRPPTVNEVDQYDLRHWQRLTIKPGITGEWQVKGRSTIRDFEQVVDLDLRYLQHWSVRYDLLLILKTIWIVLLRHGAY